MTRKTYPFPKNTVVVPHRHPQIVVSYDADLPRADTNLPRVRVENGGNQKANFVCNKAEESRKTWEGSFKCHCRNRAPFDLPSVHFTMIFSMASLRL